MADATRGNGIRAFELTSTTGTTYQRISGANREFNVEFTQETGEGGAGNIQPSLSFNYVIKT